MEAYANSHSSPEPVEGFLLENSSGGELSWQLNVTPSPQAFSSPGRTTARFALSPYGMTCGHLMAESGAALLTWCRAAFPARPTAAHLEDARLADDLWPEMRRVVADVAPRVVFAENTERRAIDRAADNLEEMGYEVRCMELSAADMGADHIRQRYWLLAYAHPHGELRMQVNAKVAQLPRVRPRVWEAYPDEPRVADGLAHRMVRLQATGNGQVPCVAATAFRLLASQFGEPS